MVDIIILGFDTPEQDEQCLQGIFENTKYSHYKITWYNNYFHKYSVSKAWNNLINQTDGEYICLLHNDAIVGKDWLIKLIDVFNDSEVGAVGPSFDNCLGVQKILYRKIPKRKTLVDLEEESGKSFQLSSICLIFPRKIWEEIGLFNEKFYLHAETEFLHRVQLKKFKTIWRQDVYVKHCGGVSRKKREKKDKVFDFAEEKRKANKLYIKAIRESREVS